MLLYRTKPFVVQSTLVEGDRVTPVSETFHFKTQLKVPRVGLMLVGLGGNNGTTVTAGILANKNKITWRTKVKVVLERESGCMDGDATRNIILHS